MKVHPLRRRHSRNNPAFRRGLIRRAAIAVMFLAGAAASASAAGVTVQQPRMRFIIKERPAGGYFTLQNDTDAPVTLTGVASSACGMMMLHQTKEVGGVEEMLPVKNVTVPAHGTVSFQPGGYHVMCMQPQSSMVVGDKVPVTLNFADGKSIVAQFMVEGANGK
jgi:copper(I)-binding protein